MQRLWRFSCGCIRRPHLPFSRRASSARNSGIAAEPPSCIENSRHVSSPSALLHNNCEFSAVSSTSYPFLSKTSVIVAVSAAAFVAAYTVKDGELPMQRVKLAAVYSEVGTAIEKSNESINMVIDKMKQTGVAASVLRQSLRCMMSSANHEVVAGFEFCVASLLADIVKASNSRRAAIVSAGGGAVVDWLLETVAVPKDSIGTQDEAARALAYLIADPDVCEAVFGRPHAVPNMLRFIFSAQPQRSRKLQSRSNSFDVSGIGKSMLVASIMDVVTSKCKNVEKSSIKPMLPKNAEVRDVRAAIEVITEGGVHWDEQHGDRDGQAKLSSTVVPGLWDDLQCDHVAVPFAAWALANWAFASELNRSHIHELDQDGNAVMRTLMAPERSVKWHGSWLARLLLEDQNLPLNGSVLDWSCSLLFTISQAIKIQDIPLAEGALSAFLVSLERSCEAREVATDTGLYLMREAAKLTVKQKSVQESLAKALELISSGGLLMSLDESKEWSPILLSWIFGKLSSDTMRSVAINILSHIIEDYGSSAILLSQGWLTFLLMDSLKCKKETLAKDSPELSGDKKVKTQIDLSKIALASQTATQLANSVITLARAPVGSATESTDASTFGDILSPEPFAGSLKTMNKEKAWRISATDSASVTLKAIKELTEICADDPLCQSRIADFGVLHLLKRFLVEDDYEQLAALEAYDDASCAREAQDKVSSSHDSSVVDAHDPSNLRVPATARIRRYAARLLTILSVLPKVQKAIVADKAWCKWLEECSRGQIPGCNDIKLQSYARATLLNAFCNNPATSSADSSSVEKQQHCPHYSDMIFLVNPESPHWKSRNKKLLNSVDNGKIDQDSTELGDRSLSRTLGDDYSRPSTSGSENLPYNPPLDVVFVHGLCGGPFKTWRISEDKLSTKSGLVEKIDEEAGKQGTFWPAEWLGADFPHARIFSLKYKTNLTQWSGSSLPLQEVGSMLLDKLIAAGIGDQPVVFVTHSMGGLVVKHMLHQANAKKEDNFVNNTVGVIFYSCPHFGSKLADIPCRMGFVLRPAPTIGELRSGSQKLEELNDFLHERHKKKLIDVLSFCETKVTPIVEGYGGWALRMEIVHMESAYPGFGELVVLDSTDHINSCKPLSKADPSYKDTLDFLQKLKSQYAGEDSLH